MTNFLRLNGIAVPVATGSEASLAPDAIGKMRRTANGSANVSRRLRKGGWKFSTPPLAAAEALAWRELIAGEGHVLSFDAQNYYTSQGMAPVSIGSGWSFTTSGPKYGAACAQWSAGANYTQWALFTPGGPYSIGYWLNVGGGGYHHVWLNSAGYSWLDGVLATGSYPAGWSSPTEAFGGVSPSGVASIGSAVASKLDNLVALPFVAPDSWAGQIYNFGSPFAPLPVVTADGLFIEQNLVAKSVVGSDAPTGKIIPTEGTKNLHSFSFQLSEV